jgi:serine/threonine protein kinase
MFHYYQDPKRYLLVTEFCNGGNLFEAFSKKKKEEEVFKVDEVAIIIKQILSALRYMHKNKIVHRDVKLGNIMLSQKNDFNDIKLIDFNYAAHWLHYLWGEKQDVL